MNNKRLIDALILASIGVIFLTLSMICPADHVKLVGDILVGFIIMLCVGFSLDYILATR